MTRIFFSFAFKFDLINFYDAITQDKVDEYKSYRDLRIFNKNDFRI